MPTLIAAIDARAAKAGAAEFNAATASMTGSAARVTASIGQTEHVARLLGGSLGATALRFGVMGFAILKTKQHLGTFINEADRLFDLSQRFNLPVETLSILGDEARLAGADVEGVAKALQRLSVAETQALRDVKGSGESARAFKDLDITIRDVSGSAEGLQQLFEDVAASIASIDDPARQADLAVKLLGKSGGDLVPFLEEFTRSGGFGGKFARVSSETAAAADKWNDAVERLGKSFDVFLGKISPAIDAAAEFFDVINGGTRQQRPPSLPQSAAAKQLDTLLRRANDEVQRARAALAQLDDGQTQLQIARAQAEALRGELGREPSDHPLLSASGQRLSAAQRLAEVLARIAELEKQDPAVLAASKALAEAEKSRADALADVHRLRADQAEFDDPAQINALAESRNAFLKTLEDETFAIGKNNLAGQRELLLRKALTLAVDEQDEATKKFLENARAGIAGLTSRAFENVALEAVKDLNLEIERFGKTAAEVRQLDFERLFEGFEDKSGVIARAREDFSRLNQELQRLGDNKIFEDQVRLLSQAVTLARLGVDAREEEAAVLDLINATQGRITLEQEQQVRALIRARQEADRIFQLADDTARALGDGAAEAVTRFSELSDVLENVYQQLVRIGAQTFIAQPLTNFLSGIFGGLLGNARGNVFSGGRVRAFAMGGVFHGPTYFPMADGNTGLLGESGPEAVIPLDHDPATGKLGLKGGVTNITQVFNIRTPDAASFRSSRKQILDDMRRAARSA